MRGYGTEPAHLQLRKFDAHSIKFLEVTTVNEKNKQYYLYINGEAVPVTEKVYKTFWYFEDKEDYFMRQLKIPRRTQDKETCESVVVPAREVPMEEYSVWCKKNTAPMWEYLTQ